MPYSRFYRVNNTQPGEALLLSGKEWDGLTFRKELIYEDDFHKKTPTVDQHFTVDTLKLDHWCATGNRMISNGVPIPVPIKHTTDPEARRGSVVRFERGKNKNGKEALFGIIRFRDRKAAELAKSTDVSIFVPKDTVTDGKGREYVYPVRHVCLTDYPVIPGLSGFDAIAASLDSNIIHVPKKIPKLGRLAAVKSFGKHLAVGTAVGHVTAKLGERLGGKKGKIVGEIGGHLLGGHLAHKVNPSHLKLAANVVRKTMMRHPAIALTVGAFAAGEALKKGLGKPKAPKAPKPVGLMASLALSSNIATEGIKVYPTDPPNVVGRIGGRFAPNPNSKMRQQRVRGGVREHNRLANLVFRGSNNKPNPDPKFDDVVANVKNNFHELFHESASDSHKGVLHAAKHLAVAGSAAGLAVEGYRRIHSKVKANAAPVVKKLSRAVRATLVTKSPEDVRQAQRVVNKAQKAFDIKQAKHAKIKTAIKTGKKINRRIPTSEELTSARKLLQKAQDSLTKAKAVAFTKAAAHAAVKKDFKSQVVSAAKFAPKAAKHILKRSYRIGAQLGPKLTPGRLKAAAGVLGGAAAVTTVVGHELRAARRSLQ